MEGWGAELRRVAAELHAFMASSSLSHWTEAPPPPTPSDPLPEADSAASAAAADSPCGLPILPACELLLQRVAYAPSVSNRSPWASEVRVRSDALLGVYLGRL